MNTATIATSLRQSIVDDCGDVKPEENPDGTGIAHLVWMCEQLALHPEWPEHKSHRWIGYIQCGLVMNEITTLEHESSRIRNAT